MTNKQLAVARRVANRFPDAVLTSAPGGISVNGQTIAVPTNMTIEALETALKAAAYG